MKVLVTCEHRFYRSADGRVWTDTQCPYSFWRRYLDEFDHVDVLARVQPVDALPEGWREASGPSVRFIDVPYYLGPVEYLKVRGAVRRVVASAVRGSDATLLRIPSQLGGIAAETLRRLGRPYSLEVVGDPYEVFSAGASLTRCACTGAGTSAACSGGSVGRRAAPPMSPRGRCSGVIPARGRERRT
jgi:hypothetical protein